ncbi:MULTISPECIES: vitamin K epoxide reductase family protein [Streptomyces]|uniref:Vitamin K epoxide reductase family protein n=1 Tax=Streptomyces desertarenae TaxID=2666184 RepID=A0ABW4PNU7_9ACTN
MTTTTAPRDDLARTAEDAPVRRGAVGAGRAYALLLVITGLAGVLAAWVITVDKFRLLEAEIAGEEFIPACSLNPIVSCGDVMESAQAEAFGFPNPVLGLVTYGIIVCVGMSLLAGARFPRWYWLTMNAGMLFGVGFCTWLMYQSLYNIGSLCLWCNLAWVATLLMFWYTTFRNVRNGFLPAPGWLRSTVTEFHWVIPAVHIGIIGMLILTRWWSFWTS